MSETTVVCLLWAFYALLGIYIYFLVSYPLIIFVVTFFVFAIVSIIGYLVERRDKRELKNGTSRPKD